MKRLFVIGNGFDIAHDLPTRFDPHFKNIARKYEQDNFWDIYSSREYDIWSDFENLLGCPDYNSLVEIFDSYAPDYLSDRESDRDGIIYQVDLNGRLDEALDEFANKAETALTNTKKDKFIEYVVDKDGYYVSFNYTHTLEEIYDIPYDQVLHIHGEVGDSDLLLGYTKGNYTPEKYSYDVRGKGRGPYAEVDIEDYFSGIEDFYVRTAFEGLVNKCKSFYKEVQIDLLKGFLDDNLCVLDEIILYGHSCAIDYDYFEYLNKRYPSAKWKIYVFGKDQQYNAEYLIDSYGIVNSEIIDLLQ